MRKISCTISGREAEGGLVEQHQARAQHQRAADRQHLLLAARQRAGLLVEARLQDGKVLVDHLAVALDRRLVGARVGGNAQVLVDAEVGEGAAAFRYVADAAAHDLLRRHADDRAAVELDRALRTHHAADGAQRRRLAGAVGAEQRGDAALRQREAHVVQRLRLSVVGLQALHLEQRCHVRPPFRGRRGSRRGSSAPPPACPRRSCGRNRWRRPCRTPT